MLTGFGKPLYTEICTKQRSADVNWFGKPLSTEICTKQRRADVTGLVNHCILKYVPSKGGQMLLVW